MAKCKITDKQAAARARGMYGARAYVNRSTFIGPRRACDSERCLVGVVVNVAGLLFRETKASGFTWEETFDTLERNRRGLHLKLLREELEELIPLVPPGDLHDQLEYALGQHDR